MVDTVPKPFVFVLMPFDESFDDVYQLGIRPACESAGSYCERVDEQIFAESILTRIYNQIAKSDLIVADMTGRNPNVFYEVGYAHALGKTVILLTSTSDDIPFDFKHYPHIIYSGRITQFKDDLERRVRWYLQNPGQEREGGDGRVVFTIAGTEVHDNVEIHFPVDARRFAGYYPLTIGVHNPEDTLLSDYTSKLGLVTPPALLSSTEHNTVQLPDKRFLYDLGNVGEILPGAWNSVSADLDADALVAYVDASESVPLELRLFTPVGSHTVAFRLKLDVE